MSNIGHTNGQGPVPPPPLVAAPWFAINTPEHLCPVPMNCQFRVDQIQMPDGKMGVLVRLATNGGMWINMLDADFAVQMGEGVLRCAQASKAGLVVPPQ